jgi:hypothetical protein
LDSDIPEAFGFSLERIANATLLRRSQIAIADFE